MVLALALLLPTPALAQEASVPMPNDNGDFMTARVRGVAGYYNNRQWLVTDLMDAVPLNCRRTPNGEVQARLKSGATLTAIFASQGNRDAITMNNGKPWLRVRSVNPVFNRDSGICYVRANVKYIAPINEEYVSDVN